MADSSENGSLGKRQRNKGKAFYNKTSGKKYMRRTTRHELSSGMQGVLITTGDQEKLCVPEAYNLLNQFADQLYGPEYPAPDEQALEEDDVAASLAREVADLKGKQQGERRFQSVSSGARNVLFISCSSIIQPCHLVHSLLSGVLAKGERVSRYCQRLIPVVNVCHANVSDITKHATDVLEPHFHANPDKIIKFAITYKARNNNVLKRDDIIKLVADLVTNNDEYKHTVDLSNPELTVVVEIIKNLCCLSVVKDFHKLCKYNIHALTESVTPTVPQETTPIVPPETMPTGPQETTPTVPQETTDKPSEDESASNTEIADTEVK